MEIGTKIMLARKELKMKQSELAAKSGVSVATISLVENNINTTLLTLKTICDVLGKDFVIDLIDKNDGLSTR